MVDNFSYRYFARASFLLFCICAAAVDLIFLLFLLRSILFHSFFSLLDKLL